MKVIDLSQTLHDGMAVYPGDPEVKIHLVQDYDDHHWQVRNLSMGSHTGSHVDAFSHMHKDKESIDEIPLERFFGRAQCLHKEDVFPVGMGLLFNQAVDLTSLDKILAAQPNFVGGLMDEALERALLKQGIVTYTNLCNLELLPLSVSFMFYGLPLKIKEGDGSPVRAMAVLEEVFTEKILTP